MCECCDQPLEKFELEEIVDHWLYEVEKKAKKVIKLAENTEVAPLTDDDIRQIISIIVEWDIGMSVKASRVNDLTELMRVNFIIRPR